VIVYFEHSAKIERYWRSQSGSEADDLRSCFGGFPKIVVVIDSIEQWSPLILSSLIYTLWGITENYGTNTVPSNSERIPFIVVLGVSTTEDLLSRMIEPDALRLLSVSRHHLEPSHKLYQQLAEEILIERSPILFDCCVLNKLLNHYQLNDYSVARFKDQIRYLFMSYFINTKASQYAAYFMNLRERRLDDAERESHFYRWWFDAECPFVESVLQHTDFNEGDPAELWKECLDDAFAVYQRYRDALRVFKMITDTLGLSWSRTQIIAKLQDTELLLKYLLARVGAVDSVIKIHRDDRAQFPPKISSFDECHEIYKILERNTKAFDADFARKAKMEYKQITDKRDGKEADSSTTATVKVNKRMSSAARKKQQKQQLMAKTNRTLYGEGRTNLFKLMQSFIEKHLKPMNQLPLHHIFVYSKEAEFSADMFPPNAGQIRKRFKSSEAFMIAQGGDRDTLETEDLGNIYEFYAGCDSMYVNLHDAYVTFKHRMEGVEEEEEEENGKEEEDHNGNRNRKGAERSNHEVEKEKLTQIRFRMSIDDLRFCGFLKATNRKKEALMKMAELF